MNRIVIGLVGPMVSGKGDIGKYLSDHGFIYQSLSDRCREEADLRGLPRERHILQDIGNDLRKTYGLHVLAERTVQMLEGIESHIVIDAIRNPGEVIFLREQLGAVILGIDAPIEKRIEWGIERGVSRGEDPSTIEEMIKSIKRDLGEGEPIEGQQVEKSLAMADLIIINDDTREALIEKLNEVLLSEFGLSLEGVKNSKETK